MKHVALLTALLSVGAIAQAARHAPISNGARDLMAEEVMSWNEPGQFRMSRQVVLNGEIELVGTPSAAQVFNRGKLIPCQVQPDASGGVAATRYSCDNNKRIYLPLTNGVDPATQVPQGVYLLGFENSIYPGYVVVRPGQKTSIRLNQVEVPPGGTVKIFRDMTALDEQRKLYFTTYTAGQSFFSEGEWPFGDLYIRRWGVNNGPPDLDYKLCEQQALPELTTKGERLCRAWNQGSFMSLMEMFEFRSDGRFNQWEVRKPGKPYAYRFNRLLVAKATDSAHATYVNVLPGAYAVEITDAKGVATKKTVVVGQTDTTGHVASFYGNLPQPESLRLNGAAPAPKPVAVDPTNVVITGDPDSAPDVVVDVACTQAKMWRTENRAYCKLDTADGCNRATARLCEPMFDIP